MRSWPPSAAAPRSRVSGTPRRTCGGRSRRRRSRERARVDRVEVAYFAEGPESGVVGRVDVASALAELAPRVRACVVLRYLADQSTGETAHALGLSEGAVKRYVSDGVRALNAMLGTVASDDERAPVRPAGGGHR
jgi:DNA-directed RNA polymerase specialized sigma24 family protein